MKKANSFLLLLFSISLLLSTRSFSQSTSQRLDTSGLLAAQNWASVNFQCKSNVSSSVIYKDTLYVGGNFGLQKWNGTKWDTIKGIFSISSLTVYNGCLYAGGNGNYYYDDSKNHFHNIAKWDGAKWEGVGGGFLGGFDNVEIKSLCVFNGVLFAGGSFSTAGEAEANGIAKWNGTKWESVGTGFDGTVSALIVFKNNLYVGGSFSIKLGASMPISNNKRIAKWDGFTWKDATTGLETGSRKVLCFAIYKDTLFAGGDFMTGNYRGKQTGYVAKYDGAKWVNVSTGLACGTDNGYCSINAMTVYHDKLYVGGRITAAFLNMEPLSINSIAQWDGKAWSNVGEGIARAPDENFANKYVGEVYSLLVFNNSLYVGGYFTIAGDIPVMNLAKWSNSK